MKTRTYQSVPKCLLVVSIASILSACGGGASDSTANGVDTELVELSKTSMTGTVVIEERNGKTVFDGWFTQTSASEALAGPVDSTISEDSCQVSSVRADGVQNAALELAAAQPADEHASVGQAVKIESRLGEFESLVRQQVGATTVYAPEERWKSVALPDDAVLSIDADEDSGLGELGSLAIPPIMPLVWLVPESGVMTSAASSLQWEPSFNEEVKIKLRLSAIDFSDSEFPVVVSISCDLIDDGLYTLPAEFQQQLPDDVMGISVYAVREHVQHIENGDTSLNIVQLSYPSPL